MLHHEIRLNDNQFMSPYNAHLFAKGFAELADKDLNTCPFSAVHFFRNVKAVGFHHICKLKTDSPFFPVVEYREGQRLSHSLQNFDRNHKNVVAVNDVYLFKIIDRHGK